MEALLVEALNVVRAGLDMLISSASGLQVLASTGDVVEGLEEMRRIRARGKVVILAGLELTGERDAFWLVRAVREEFPRSSSSSPGPIWTASPMEVGGND